MDERLRALVDDLDLALRSELGARSVYPLLRRLTRDEELRAVLERLHEDERRIVEELRELMRGLGARPRRRSFRRTAASWLVAAMTPPFGMRFALRLCHDAECTVSRWYAVYRDWFVEARDLERARAFDALSQAKDRHAQWLDTWVRHFPLRRGME